MKKIVAMTFLLFFSLTVRAAAPTPESIDRLLEVSQAGKILDAIRPQMEKLVKDGEQLAVKGQTPNADQQKILDKYRARTLAIMNEELTIEKMKPVFVEIYSKYFTQEDVDAFIAFYESKAGQAYVTKMPTAMRSMMTSMPMRLAPMIEKMQQNAKEMKAEMDALNNGNAQ